MCDELEEKVNGYLKKAKPLFEGLKIDTDSTIDIEKASKEVLEMALCYYNDAIHFYENENYVNALAALEYAEGWMDAGKRIGILR